MGKRTALYNKHIENQARMVDFGGWDMPLHYGSQIDEHHCVRQDGGMFDVSHMTIVDITGEQAKPYLLKLLANNVNKLRQSGRALYGCMLNERGGVIDDLITYYFSDDEFRLVVNAATRDKDLQWMEKQARPYGVAVREREDLAMIAIQGPKARETVLSLLAGEHRERASSLPSFAGVELDDRFIARTGYTGEDGFEVMLPNEAAIDFWQELLDNGITPVGLGARDTLRLEAGLNLYGADMDEDITPLECGLSWTIAWEPEERDFIGREPLQNQKRVGVKYKRVGLILEGKGVLRAHQKVIVYDDGEGEITSGTFSPTLGVGIALARVPVTTGDFCRVEVRGKLRPVKVIKPPFVRHGKSNH